MLHNGGGQHVPATEGRDGSDRSGRVAGGGSAGCRRQHVIHEPGFGATGFDEATLSAPALTAEAGEDAVELRWQAVPGAVRYELLVWTSADGFQEIGGDNLTGTTYSHTGACGGHNLPLRGACAERVGRGE